MTFRTIQDRCRSLRHSIQGRPRKAARCVEAFSLIEVCVAMSIILISFVSIFASITLGLSITQSTRENLRATQIMLDKMEGVRLYNWSQLNDTNILVPNFTNWFYETNDIGMEIASGNGVQYTGAVVVASVPTNIIPASASYTTNMRMITVNIGWTSQGRTHTNSMSTMSSQMGMQNYIYNN